MAMEIRLKKDYFKVVKSLQPSDLLNACSITFGNSIANDLAKKFKSHRHKWRKEDCVNYIFEVMNFAYLKEKFSYVQLAGIALHSKRRIWYAFELCGRKINDMQSEAGLKKDFARTFDKMDLKYDIAVIMHEEVAWIRLAMTSSKTDNVLCIAYFIGEGFIFINKRKINFKLMQAISSALKYESLETLELNGRDVWTLLKILNQKKSKALNVKVRSDECNNRGYLQNSMVNHFSGDNSLKAEIKNCFVSNSPDFDSFTIKSESGFRIGELLPEMEGYPCRSKIRISNPDLGEFLIEATQGNVVTQPLPQYVKYFFSTGKNVITLKDPNAKK